MIYLSDDKIAAFIESGKYASLVKMVTIKSEDFQDEIFSIIAYHLQENNAVSKAAKKLHTEIAAKKDAALKAANQNSILEDFLYEEKEMIIAFNIMNK